MSKKNVVLAFSGGLDTAFCTVYLREQGYDVTTVTVDTGGFPPEQLANIAALSAKLGAVEHIKVDARGTLFEGYLRYLIAGNVLRGQLYPLSVSAERACQAVEVVRVAREKGVQSLAHGSTGAGNDQVRFDVAFRSLAGDLELLTPIRTLGLSRQQELSFLAERGIHMPPKLGSYSVNEGMWGTSVGGSETLNSWSALPEAAFPSGEIPTDLKPRPLTVGFDKGVPSSLDGKALGPVELVEALNVLGRQYGIGRGVHLGDTILGIKGRVGFEAPAAHLLITSHRELEKLVLSGKQLFWKETVGNLYGSLLHEGHFFDPLVKDLEAFLTSSQERVTGEVRLVLHPRTLVVEGVRSPYSLMDAKVATYGEANVLWTGSEAAGFAKLYGVAQMLSHKAKGG
ncbi:argininosuccinate synthase [Myxococcus sp. K38C18041901]|uniref:argininosuccinate synthase n=1 Tax=Myxococcus guangdongensis TaxID=2906760 RepID=UPI0020A7C4C2|nr:argininosuccinate synthase [Myxococcus guangdongensis]MCP3057569.1 argininosuccinate synthase [Myxococcus guangdongensis]